MESYSFLVQEQVLPAQAQHRKTRVLGLPWIVAPFVPDFIGKVVVSSPPGSNDELLSDVLWAEKLSFVSGQAPRAPLAVEAKIRYRSQAAPALLTLDDGRAEVRFERAQRAITPGQAVVFYQGQKVLGGGIIVESAGGN